MLHLINKSPFESMSFEDCLKYASSGSPILFYEDGVYGAMAGSSLEGRIKEIMGDHDVYVLKEDLALRGLERIVDGVKEVDYAGLVGLTEEHKTASW
ncbi:MAG: sulfurtransferase complex subunit TusB [Thermoleophilia bacterium]|nr:sulfurtransferase complex subunit TusB [Thermoleophilia bacterium]